MSYFSDVEISANNTFTVSDEFCPPYPPIDPEPEMNSQRININPTLSVYVSDPNNDPMDIYFYDSNDNIIDSVKNVQQDTRVSVTWENLEYGHIYQWYVIAEDNEGFTKSDNWVFFTDYKPAKPTVLSPDNNSNNVNLSPTLKVNIYDLDDSELNISFYDASNDQIIGLCPNAVDNASIIWTNLNYEQKYQWYAIADDGMVQTQSDTWIFTTKSPPPTSSPPSSHNPPQNKKPTADAGGNYNANISENILFNASKSYDSDGDIEGYRWDFNGDGTYDTDWNASSTINHSYLEAGTYSCVLEVKDNDGSTDTNVSIVTIKGLDILSIDVTPNPQNINDYVNITCTITNSSKIVDVLINITSPDNIYTKTSIYSNKIENKSIFYLNQTYDKIGKYSYYIIVNDTVNNIKKSENKNFTIKDMVPPEINWIDINPETQVVNGYINITVNATDNIALDEVYINITKPDTLTIETNMIKIQGTDNYYYNTTYSQKGEYNFIIKAIDQSLNIKTSNENFFNITET